MFVAHHSTYDSLSNVSNVHDVQAQERCGGHLTAENLGEYISTGSDIVGKSGASNKPGVDHGEIQRADAVLALGQIPRSPLCKSFRLGVRFAAVEKWSVKGEQRRKEDGKNDARVS